ncbi:hypothetical protein V1517DRAFT_341375 [Lipomyces orientalis]|uniref:Uncharacterized protein n=1 Tax=Lipomyces orientalis TaxID=1233043 RepID=A0ACC3TF48_9ASCO
MVQDILFDGTPTPVMKARQVSTTALQTEHDKELLDGLDKAGFKVDRGPDPAGLLKYWATTIDELEDKYERIWWRRLF